MSLNITYFVHGSTPDNENSRSSGNFDVELSPLGEQQALQLKEAVADRQFDVVICSDLKRARRTAEVAFDGKAEIVFDNRLRECDYGDFTRHDEHEMFRLKREHIEEPFPNGESYKDVEARIKSLLEDLKMKYDGKHIAFMSHQAPQLALEVLLNGKTWIEAFDTDWRNTKSYKHGWDYEAVV